MVANKVAVPRDPKTSAELHSEMLEDREQVRAQRLYRERTIGPTGQAAGYAFAGLIMLITFALAGLVAAGVIPPRIANYLIPIVVLTLFFGGLFGILRWQSGGRRADPSVDTTVTASASATSSAQQARLLRLERFAEPRIMAAWYAGRTIKGTEVFWGLVFVGPAAFGAVAFSASVVVGHDSLTGHEGKLLAGLWFAVLIGASVIVAFRRRRVMRMARDAEIFSRLGALLGGRVLDFGGVIRWLNGHWAASSRAEELHRGNAEYAVSTVVNGYPVLLDYEPDGRSDEYVAYPPRIVIYLAALLPADFASSECAVNLQNQLSSAGFELECHEGTGLLVRATPLALAPLIAYPTLLVERTPPLVQALVGTARHSGASPASSAVDLAAPFGGRDLAS